MVRFRPIMRMIVDALACGSVLVGAVVAVLWVRSYFWENRVTRYRDGIAQDDTSIWGAGSSLGLLSAVFTHNVNWPRTDLDPARTWGPDRETTWTRWSGYNPHRVNWQMQALKNLVNFRFWTEVDEANRMEVPPFPPNSPPIPVGHATKTWRAEVPHWAIVLPMLAWPIFRIRGRLRTRRSRRLGLCGKCGYDLRATPDRCPECGDVPSSFSKRSSAPDSSLTVYAIRKGSFSPFPAPPAPQPHQNEPVARP